MKRPAPTHPIDAIVMRRLDALENLIDSDYEEKPSVFQEKTGIKMAQVGQWFSGYRALRDKALRRLEEKTGKCEGWFDGVRTPAETATAALTSPTPSLQASGGSSQQSSKAKVLAEEFDRIVDEDLRAKVLIKFLDEIHQARGSPGSKQDVSRGPNEKPKAA